MGPYNKVHTDFIEIYFDLLFFVFLEFMSYSYQPHRIEIREIHHRLQCHRNYEHGEAKSYCMNVLRLSLLNHFCLDTIRTKYST